jgi:hypothetical protein
MIQGRAYLNDWRNLRFDTSTANLFDSKLATINVIAIAAAIRLLGLGAFLLVALLFGRREIFVPTPRSLKS